MRKPYDSDITREQFAHISGDLESVKKRTCPRKVDLYDVFCAILYLLKGGVTWRNIPHDFPKKGIVRYERTFGTFVPDTNLSTHMTSGTKKNENVRAGKQKAEFL